MSQSAEMFMRDMNPRRRAVFDEQHRPQHPAPETGFRFCLAKPRMIGKYRIDRYIIYRPRVVDASMAKTKHVSRPVRTQDPSRTVLHSPPGMNIPIHGPFEPSSSPTYVDPMSLNATENPITPDVHDNDALEAAAKWFNSTGIPSGEVNPYTHAYYDDMLNSLGYGTATNTSGGPNSSVAGCGMPTYFDSSSPSSYPLNGSSPNTMFGSFSSSIGPPDQMDLDLPEFTPGPLGVPEGVTTTQGLYPGTHVAQQRSALANPPPAPLFPITPNPGTAEPRTTCISPSMLHINPITTGLPAANSSESLSDPFTPFHVDTDSDDVQSGIVQPVHERYILPSSSGQQRPRGAPNTRNNNSNTAAQPANTGTKWGRKQLPDKAPVPRQVYPSNQGSSLSSSSRRRVASDNTISTASGAQPKRSSRPKKKTTSPKLQLPNRNRPANLPSTPAKATIAIKAKPPAAMFSTPDDGENDEDDDDDADDDADADIAVNPEWSPSDQFLVKSRLSGMKYKDIRSHGNFKEAESTLRGRFRSLTKPREARVRNPKWEEIDDKLLKEGVAKLSKSTNGVSWVNTPWRAVADYIRDNGGTYHFGNNTCHKRWDYLNKTSAEQVKKDRARGRKEH